MNTTATKSSGAGKAVRPSVPTPETASNVPGAAEAQPKAGSCAEDWSDPNKLRQMNAIWPLLWLLIPFVLLIVHGFFSGD